MEADGVEGTLISVSLTSETAARCAPVAFDRLVVAPAAAGRTFCSNCGGCTERGSELFKLFRLIVVVFLAEGGAAAMDVETGGAGGGPNVGTSSSSISFEPFQAGWDRSAEGEAGTAVGRLLAPESSPRSGDWF